MSHSHFQNDSYSADRTSITGHPVKFGIYQRICNSREYTSGNLYAKIGVSHSFSWYLKRYGMAPKSAAKSSRKIDVYSPQWQILCQGKW